MDIFLGNNSGDKSELVNGYSIVSLYPDRSSSVVFIAGAVKEIEPRIGKLGFDDWRLFLGEQQKLRKISQKSTQFPILRSNEVSKPLNNTLVISNEGGIAETHLPCHVPITLDYS